MLTALLSVGILAQLSSQRLTPGTAWLQGSLIQERRQQRLDNQGKTPASSSSAAVPAVRADNQTAVYLSAPSVKNEAFFEDTLAALEKAGAHAFVVDVKGSQVYFASAAPLAAELKLVKPILDLPAVVQKAHARGFYVIARFISLKDPLLAQKKPETQIRNPKTGHSVGNVWVDGSVPYTLQYNREILKDVLLAGVDEVNLDYIRFPTEYSQASIGMSGQVKADHIEPFIRMARETIDTYAPRAKLGISTYAILGWSFNVNREAIGQDFVRFAPLVDVISPMAYQDTFAENAYYYPGKNPRSRPYYLVWKTLKGYADLLGPEQALKLRPWIQGYYVTTQDMRDEIDAVYDAGACGYSIWNANNHYAVSYPAIAKAVIPERCKSNSQSWLGQ
jgi:hypothetical protein